MRVFLDECVPRQIRRAMSGHDVLTVRKKRWSGKKNGELLGLMAGDGFQVLLTVDQSLRHQQNLARFGIAILLMIGRSNRELDLLPLIPDVLAALDVIQPGEVIEVSNQARASGP
jgi:hypothetical protein